MVKDSSRESFLFDGLMQRQQQEGFRDSLKAPVLPQLDSNDASLLFPKRPPLKLVVEHLRKMSEGLVTLLLPVAKRVVC